MISKQLTFFRMVKINKKYYKNFTIEIKQFSDIEITTTDEKRTVKVKKNKCKRNKMNENDNIGKNNHGKKKQN
jgi:hypothetical protein